MIEYRDAVYSYGYGTVTFQVVFFENSPKIQFNYSDVASGTPATTTAPPRRVGVQ